MSTSRFVNNAGIAAAIAACGVFAWYWCLIAPATLTDKPWGTGDLYTQIYPMSFRAAEWIRSGVLPLWNPYQYAGHPFLATGLYGVLYPPNVVYLVFPTAIALEVVMVMHLAAAGIFTFAFARAVLDRTDAAFVAAVTFMLSGFMIREMSWFSPAVASGTWLPLALLAVERIATRTSLAWVAVLASALALAFLGGWPQTWLYTCYVVGAYTVARLVVVVVRRRGTVCSVFPVLGKLIAAAILAALLMAPQLLPTLELQGEGPRRVGGLTTEQQLVAFPPGIDALFAGAVDAPPGRPKIAYLGMAVFILVPLAFVGRAASWRVFVFAGLALFAVSVAATPLSPAFSLYNLMGGARFRAPVRILYVYAFTAAMLAAYGFATVERGREDRAIRRGVLIIALAVGLGSFRFVMPPQSRIFLGIVVALVVAVVLAPSRRLGNVAVVALVGFMVFDLTRAVQNPHRRPSQDPEPLDRNAKAFAFVKERQGYHRTYIRSHFEETPMMAKQGTLREIYSITDYEPLSLQRYDRFFHEVEPPAMHRGAALTFTGSLRAELTSPRFQLLDVMSLRFLVVYRSAVHEMARLAQRVPVWRLALRPSEGQVLVYEHIDPLPRAYVSPLWEVANSEDAALAAITQETFNPRKKTIIEDGFDAEALVARADVGDAAIVPATITDYQPVRVTIEADAAQPGYLVLTDTYYAGWHANVDGEPAPIVRANYLFRAVHLDTGRHVVTFSYEPMSFTVGAWCGLTGILALCGLVLADRMRKRRFGRVAGEALATRESAVP